MRKILSALLLSSIVVCNALGEDTTTQGLYLHGITSLNMRNLDEAADLFTQIIDRDPYYYKAYEKLVKAREERHDLPGVIQYFEKRQAGQPRNPYLYYGLGLAFKAEKQYDRALALLEKCRRLAPEFDSPYLEISDVYRAQGNLGAAISYFRAEAQARPGQARVLLGLGYVYWLNSDFEKSLKALNASIALDTYNLTAYRIKNLVCWSMGKFSDSVKTCEAINRLADEKNDIELLVANYRNLGLAYEIFNRDVEARACYERALRLARQIADRYRETQALYELGSIHFAKFGKYAEALDYLRRAAQLSKTTSRLFESWSLLRMGELYYRLNDFSNAYESSTKALDISQEIKAKEAESYAYKNIGQIYLVFEHYNEAIDFYNQALATTDDARLKESLLILLADAYYYQGMYDPALDYCKEALKINASGEDRRNRDFALAGLGVIYLETGAFADAEKYLREALAVARETKVKGKVAQWLKKLGDLECKLGRYGEAESYYRSALAMGRESDHYQAVITAYQGLATISEAQGDYAKALEYYDNAIAVIENAKYKLLPKVEKETFFREGIKIDAYEKVVSLLMLMHNEHPSQGYDQRAYHYTVRSKPTLADCVPRGRMGITKAFDASPPLPDGAALIEQVRARLKAGEVLIDYIVGEKKTFAALIGKDAFLWQELSIGRSGLKALLMEISPIFREHFDNGTQVCAANGSGARWADIQLKKLNELGGVIFKPIERHLKPGSALVIVPDDVLNYLPFGMLVTELDGYSVRFLEQTYPISYVYSAGLLNVNQIVKRRGAASPSGEILLVGNPDLSGYSRGEIRNGLIGLTGSPAGAVRLSQLPYAETEVQRVEKYFPKSRVLVGNAATESAFRKAAGSAQVIHFSGHYFFSSLDPKFVFTKGAQKSDAGGSDEDDGFLQVSEIYGLRLNAEMIVLSGCKTGLGELGQFKKGATSALAGHAFLHAGIPSLVTTLWSIEDSQATCEFMEKFYHHLLWDKMDKRAALQRAKLELIASDRYCDPFYWAPFILVGDTGKLDIAFPWWRALYSLFTSQWLFVTLTLGVIAPAILYRLRKRK